MYPMSLNSTCLTRRSSQIIQAMRSEEIRRDVTTYNTLLDLLAKETLSRYLRSAVDSFPSPPFSRSPNFIVLI